MDCACPGFLPPICFSVRYSSLNLLLTFNIHVTKNNENLFALQTQQLDGHFFTSTISCCDNLLHISCACYRFQNIYDKVRVSQLNINNICFIAKYHGKIATWLIPRCSDWMMECILFLLVILCLVRML